MAAYPARLRVFGRRIPPRCIETLYSQHQSRALGCDNTSFISARGQSGFELPSGRSRSQAHLFASSGASDPSSICKIYFPSTGKNFQPWKLPHVAIYRPLLAAWGEMMKSALVVKASLSTCQHSMCRRRVIGLELTSRCGTSPSSSPCLSRRRRLGSHDRCLSSAWRALSIARSPAQQVAQR